PGAPLREPNRKAASDNDTASYAPVEIPSATARSDRSRVMGHAASALRRTTLAYRRVRTKTASGPASRPKSCQDVLIFRQESHRYSDGRDSPIYLRNSP